MAVDDGGGASTVEGFDLGEVLPDGTDLDALAGAGGGVGGELAQRGDVGGLVEHYHQRRVQGPPGAGVRVLGGAQDGLHEGLEQRPQPSLLVGGGDQVQGGGLGDQPVHVQHPSAA